MTWPGNFKDLTHSPSLTDVSTQARDLRARIPSGVMTEKDARELLADLGKHCAKLVSKIAPTKSKHDSAQATLKDPAAKRKALIVRFPALPRSAGRCFPRRSCAATPRDLTATDAGVRPKTALWYATSTVALLLKSGGARLSG